MLFRGPVPLTLRQCRFVNTAPLVWAPLPILPDSSIHSFRTHALDPAKPALLPRGTFSELPAVSKWFNRVSEHSGPTINHAYLAQFGDTIVPLEISTNGQDDDQEAQFTQLQQNLLFFLDYFNSLSSKLPGTRVYLAQAPIADLPQKLQHDVPTPDLVLHAGKGDVYDSSIWLGQAPTYTPLHRDPNPNLFVQLSGEKAIRLLSPTAGLNVFARVKERIGERARMGPNLRGEEMMRGKEREELEREVWDDGQGETSGLEAHLSAGDAMFIPKGWWHSVKGVGDGMTGSVLWL